MSFLGNKATMRFSSRDPKAAPSRAPPRHQPFGVRRTSANGFGAAQQLQQRRPETMPTNATQNETVSATMAEVYKDLEILRQQSREASQKLDHAKLTKQRRQTALSNLESQLQLLKYSNGQKRAHILRMNDLLSKGQRALAAAQDNEHKARRDFQELERIIRVAIDAKRSVLVWERRNARALEEIKLKSDFCHDLVREAQEDLNQLDMMCKDIQHQERLLDAARQKEFQRRQELGQEYVQTRSKSSACENEVDASKQARLQSLREAEDLERQLVEIEDEQNRSMASLQGELDSVRRELEETYQQLQDKERDVNQARSILQDSWSTLMQIQQVEGHEASHDPFASVDKPVLDLALVAESVKAEAVAATDEEAAMKALQTEVEALEQEHHLCKDQLVAKSQVAAELKHSCQVEQHKEEEREQYWKHFLASYDTAKKEADEYRATMEELRDKRDQELNVARENSALAKKELQQAQTTMEAIELQLHCTKATLAHTQHALEDLKLDHDGVSLMELENQLAETEINVASLRHEKLRIETEGEGAYGGEELEKIVLSEAELKAKSAKYLKAFPALDAINYMYDSTKTLKEQKREYLRALRKDCNKRIDSARKMAKELLEAGEREEAERAKVERAAKADRKRQEEARSQHELYRKTETDAPDTAIDDEADRKQLEKLMRHKEKLRMRKQGEDFRSDSDAPSVAKPRDLFELFSQASKESDEAAKDDFGQKKVHWDDMHEFDDDGDGPIETPLVADPATQNQKLSRSSHFNDTADDMSNDGSYDTMLADIQDRQGSDKHKFGTSEDAFSSDSGDKGTFDTVMHDSDRKSLRSDDVEQSAPANKYKETHSSKEKSVPGNHSVDRSRGSSRPRFNVKNATDGDGHRRRSSKEKEYRHSSRQASDDVDHLLEPQARKKHRTQSIDDASQPSKADRNDKKHRSHSNSRKKAEDKPNMADGDGIKNSRSQSLSGHQKLAGKSKNEHSAKKHQILFPAGETNNIETEKSKPKADKVVKKHRSQSIGGDKRRSMITSDKFSGERGRTKEKSHSNYSSHLASSDPHKHKKDGDRRRSSSFGGHIDIDNKADKGRQRGSSKENHAKGRSTDKPSTMVDVGSKSKDTDKAAKRKFLSTMEKTKSGPTKPQSTDVAGFIKGPKASTGPRYFDQLNSKYASSSANLKHKASSQTSRQVDKSIATKSEKAKPAANKPLKSALKKREHGGGASDPTAASDDKELPKKQRRRLGSGSGAYKKKGIFQEEELGFSAFGFDGMA